MKRAGSDLRAEDDRLKRLAADIDALADKDFEAQRRAREIAVLRAAAAVELYRVCAALVRALNGVLVRSEVTLDPPQFEESSFRDEGRNLFQIGASGRMIEIEFETTSELLSTEDFRVPYALSGSVRAFNQAMIERHLIEEHLIFYTVERARNTWRYFDARTHRTGLVGREYLVSLLEALV